MAHAQRGRFSLANAAMKLFDLVCIVALVGSAVAHGGVYTYEIRGSLYQGSGSNFLLPLLLIDVSRNPWHIWDYGPFYGDGNSSGIPAGISSIQRRWYFWPIYDINSGNMTCNFDGAPTNSSLHVTLPAGSTIVAQYNALNFTLTPVDKTLVIFCFTLRSHMS
jgi:lytic cellulose monooxygenase (C1-hydroxylating)